MHRSKKLVTVRQRAAKVLVSAQREKGCVGAAVRRPCCRRVAAVVTATGLDSCEQAISQSVVGTAMEGGMRARQACQVDEIEAGAVAESVQIRSGGRDGQLLLERHESVEAEHRVIEVAG